MSYSEENGQVVLRMSREDYEALNRSLYTRCSLHSSLSRSAEVRLEELRELCEFLDRLNSGNPNYTPYRVEEKKS